MRWLPWKWPSSLLLGLYLAGLPVLAQNQVEVRFPGFVLQVAGVERPRLPQVQSYLWQARRDLQARSWLLPTSVTVRVHADLTSFAQQTGAPWFVLAVANRTQARLDLQRLAVVTSRGGLEATLRHELFHLAQPASWPRWRAEGEAMRFAGQRSQASPLLGIGPEQLDQLLAHPKDPDQLARAMATAYRWVAEGRR